MTEKAGTREMGKFQDSTNSREMKVGVGEGKKSDHRLMGWESLRSEGICCGTLQRTLGQGGYY